MNDDFDRDEYKRIEKMYGEIKVIKDVEETMRSKGCTGEFIENYFKMIPEFNVIYDKIKKDREVQWNERGDSQEYGELHRQGVVQGVQGTTSTRTSRRRSRRRT